MKVQPQPERFHWTVESLDADLFELGSLEEFLRLTYEEKVFEDDLHSEEYQCEQSYQRY